MDVPCACRVILICLAAGSMPAIRGGEATMIPNTRKVRAAGSINPEIECIAVAAEALKPPLSYVQVMGLSGMAFRIHALPREMWCPSTGSVRYGFDARTALAETGAIGLTILSGDELTPAVYRDRLNAAIRSGVPLPAAGSWWWGVIVGFEEAPGGPPTITLELAENGKTRAATEQPREIVVLTPGTFDKAAAVASLRNAVHLAKTRAFGEYLSGYAAYEAWMALLRLTEEDLAAQRQAHREDGGLRNCNAWQYGMLVASRRTAAEYLNGITPLFAPPEQEQLKRAAKLYTSAADALQKGVAAEWSPASRAAQADAMESALAWERQAVAALETVAQP